MATWNMLNELAGSPFAKYTAATANTESPRYAEFSGVLTEPQPDGRAKLRAADIAGDATAIQRIVRSYIDWKGLGARPWRFYPPTPVSPLRFAVSIGEDAASEIVATVDLRELSTLRSPDQVVAFVYAKLDELVDRVAEAEWAAQSETDRMAAAYELVTGPEGEVLVSTLGLSERAQRKRQEAMERQKLGSDWVTFGIDTGAFSDKPKPPAAMPAPSPATDEFTRRAQGLDLG